MTTAKTSIGKKKLKLPKLGTIVALSTATAAFVAAVRKAKSEIYRKRKAA